MFFFYCYVFFTKGETIPCKFKATNGIEQLFGLVCIPIYTVAEEMFANTYLSRIKMSMKPCMSNRSSLSIDSLPYQPTPLSCLSDPYPSFSIIPPSTMWNPRKPPHRPLAEKELLCNIFLHFKGSELIELKRLVDAAGGGHDLRHAVYSVITYEVRFMGDFRRGRSLV